MTMSMGTFLGSIAGFLGRAFGLAGCSTQAASLAMEPAVVEIIKPPMVPAVAGYVKRVVPVQAMLAQRLASVATLNTPAGRKPRISPVVRQNATVVPVARLGARKQRATPRGPQVLRARTVRQTAEIIAFPGSINSMVELQAMAA